MSAGEGRPSVALTMLTLVPGAMGGSETYARALTRELATSSRVSAHAFVAAGARGFSAPLAETVVDGFGTGSGTASRLTRLAAGTVGRRRLLDAISPVDVMHAPFTVPLPRPRAELPFVLTLHDVQHLELPELFSWKERRYRRLFYDRPARHADAVITVSAAAKASIVDRLGIESSRITVAHLGVDTSHREVSTGPREDVVLYPARGWTHKNHLRLIQAVGLLRSRRRRLRLVLTGGGLEALRPVPDWVEVLGVVDDEQLARLYRTAGCLAFPSLYEGFGLPPLEAMAHGCPVAASTAGAVPEVCGDAAYYFDPYDVAGMAQAIEQALDSEGELLQAGLDRVATFTWRSCAEVHEDVYLRLATS